jgi:hypothetical protein
VCGDFLFALATTHPCKQLKLRRPPLQFLRLRQARMFNILNQRLRDIKADINETLIGVSLEPRLMPGAATPEMAQRTVRSSASTPSLRSRDANSPWVAKMDPGGNVKVVVRVRAFLPRGKFLVQHRGRRDQHS